MAFFLALVRQGVAEADLEHAIQPALIECHVQLAGYIAAVVDSEMLRALLNSLAQYRGLQMTRLSLEPFLAMWQRGYSTSIG